MKKSFLVIVFSATAAFAEGGRPRLYGETSIDREVQKTLRDALVRYADTNDTGRAWGVVMDVRTGKVRGIADTGFASESTNVIDRVCYEPGSALKPFIAAIALDCGVAEIGSKYSMARDDKRYGDLPSDGGHVWPDEMTVGDALVKSSNVVFGKLACDIGQDRLYRGVRSFGLCEKSLSGSPKRPWDNAMMSRIGIGESIAVTALQLAHAYAILANGGVDVAGSNRVISAGTAKAICQTLERVASKEGTARRAAVEGVRVAGKTGTMQRFFDGGSTDGLYHATFAGFFPADDPKYVIVTTFETKRGDGLMHQGGYRPALAFSEIVKRLTRKENANE